MMLLAFQHRWKTGRPQIRAERVLQQFYHL
jgi:hypothetical protein